MLISLDKLKVTLYIIKLSEMNLPRSMLLLLICISSWYTSFAFPDKNIKLNKKELVYSGHSIPSGKITPYDQQLINDTALIVIPFDYKQSTLFHDYTYAVLDSVIKELLKIPAITISIAGFAYQDEGTDTICQWLSIDRANFIRDYIIARGVDSGRILSVKAYGRTRPFYKGRDNKGKILNCRAEITMRFPPPPKKPVFEDRDGDGIEDKMDNCPDEYGYAENHGCPDSAIIIPFENQQATLYDLTYHVLDSVITLLKNNPSLTITIEGHAGREEGIRSVCEELAIERSNIVKAYLLSRYISRARIDAIKNFGTFRPLNAYRNIQEVLNNCRAEIILNSH